MSLYLLPVSSTLPLSGISRLLLQVASMQRRERERERGRERERERKGGMEGRG